MGIGGKFAVGVAWVTALVWLSQWSNTDGALTGAVIATVVVAALIDTWWVLAVPVPTALLLIAVSLADAPELDSDGISGWDWAGVVSLVAGGIALLLAVGVGLGRVVRRLWTLRAERARTS